MVVTFWDHLATSYMPGYLIRQTYRKMLEIPTPYRSMSIVTSAYLMPFGQETHIHCHTGPGKLAVRDKVGHQLRRTLIVRFKGGPPTYMPGGKRSFSPNNGWLAVGCRAGARANGGSDNGRSPHREAAGVEEMTFVVE